MTEQEVINTVKEITAKKFYKLPETINLDTAFSNDLGADSLDMVEIVVESCNHFKIPTDEFEKEDITTVDKLVTLVCKNLGITRGANKGPTNIVALITVIGQKRKGIQSISKRRSK